MDESNKSSWNSLEVAKLLVTASIPLMLWVLSATYQENQKLLESVRADRQAELQREHIRQERVAKWRYAKYDELSLTLNDMYVYFIHVGKWKEMTPLDIVERKRDADRLIFSSGPVFTEQFRDKYIALIDAMFDTYQGWGEDAALRTSADHRADAASRVGIEWDPKWEHRFTREDNRKEIRAAYRELNDQLAHDLGI